MSDSEPQIKVFSATWCGYCKMVKAYLTSLNVKFTVVDIEAEPDAAMWLQQNLNQTGIPVTMFADNDFVIGFDRAQLDLKLRQYKLVK